MDQEKKRPTKKTRLVTWGVPILLVILIAYIVTGAKNKEPEPPPATAQKLPNVEVQTVRVTPFDEELVLPARLEAVRSAVVAAEFGGKIHRWKVKEGAKVADGAPLVTLDTKTLKASLAEVAAAKASANAALTVAKSTASRADASLTKAKRDASAVDLDLASAQSALELAQADYDRAEKLVSQGVSTKASLDRARDGLTQARLGVERASDAKERAELGVDVAKAALNEVNAAIKIAQARVTEVEAAQSSLEVRLAKHTIKAPFGGVIEKHLAETGEVISTGQPLTKIFDFSKIKALVSIPDRYVPFFDMDNPTLANYVSLQQPGAVSRLEASLVIQGLPKLTGDKSAGLAIPAKISRVARAADPTSNTFEVELTAENPGEALRQGMIAEGRITFLHFEKAVVIPVSSVQVTDQGPQVLVVEQAEGADIVHARTIEPLSISGDSIHIGSGLDEGDKLVTKGWKGIVPGEMINVVVQDGELVTRASEEL